MENKTDRRIFFVVLLYVSIILIGTLGYRHIEDLSWIDSLYMTVITITTVGFSEVAPLSQDGRLFTIALIFLGVGGFTYAFGTITEYLLAITFGGFMNKRKIKKMIHKLHDHYIVCGFGRVGYQVAQELRASNKPFVIVEEDEGIYQKALDLGLPAVQGNANADATLESAQIHEAKGLFSTLGSDADNLMLVLSGRALNPDLFIVARSNYEATEKKLMTAGANRVISPYSIGGRRMAQLALRPNVVEFLDVVMHEGDLELWMEEVTVGNGSPLEKSTLAEAKIRERTGAYVLGLQRPGSQFTMAPLPTTKIEAEDVLIALGTRDQLTQLAKITER